MRIEAAGSHDNVVVQRSDRLGFRPAIDGLRTLAVLAVVGYHFRKDLFPGGNSGVTVFFVLSGFLITTILLEEAASTGKVGLKAFYVRRALRLLPALGALLLVFLVAGLAIYGPGYGSTLLWFAFGAASYVNNWIMIGGVHTMLPHTWSLSVEEQFYVLWPLLLVGVLRWARRYSTVVVVTVGLAVASAVWQQWLLAGAVNVAVAPDGGRALAGTDSAAYNLLAGAVLAQLRLAGAIRITPTVRAWLRGAGTVALALWLALVLLSPYDQPVWWYGSWYTIWWCGIGVVLVLVCAEAGSGLVFSLCSLAVMRWLGRLSYGIYLWHVPAFGLVRDATPELGANAHLVLASVITLAAAATSHYTVERWFLAKKKRWVPKAAVAV